MTEQLPEPPLPADLDLSTLEYMPLLVARLRRSKAWLRAKRRPELGFYMINVWMAAWSECPAGSMEDDDDVLADAAMCAPEKWDDVKMEVMAGFTKHADGRLYHPVLVEQATIALKKRLGWRDRKKKQRGQEANNGDGPTNVTRDGTVTGSETPLGQPRETPLRDGTGRDGKYSEPEGSGAAAPSPPVVIEPDEIIPPAKPTASVTGDPLAIPLNLLRVDDYRAALFGPARKFLQSRGVPESTARSALGKMLKQAGDDARAVFELIAQAERDNRADPVAWAMSCLTPRKSGTAATLAALDRIAEEHRGH